MQALALADDLTGALEAGALLAQAGLPAVVTLPPHRAASGELLVIDTETRHATAQQARELHRSIALQHPGRIYKKTDSTLRGSIAAEFSGLLDARPGGHIHYIPAYPRVGRTVRGGVLYVDGVPLAETDFARDPRNPATASSVADLMAPLPAVTVWDAGTDDDLARIAHTIASAPLIASPAGFIPYWALTLPGRRHRAAPPPAIRSCLVVCGSLHPRSREQVSLARIPGWDVLATGEWRPGEEEIAAAGLAGRVAARLPVDALMVFGGDTARAILQRLGCQEIHPIMELLPGVPVSRIDAGGRPLTLITKAGGFGPPDLIARVHATLGKNT